MLKWLRAHNKQILAVLGVFLMIAFIIPSQAKRGGGPGSGRLVGTIGKEKITGDEIANVETEWKRLNGIMGTYVRQTGRITPDFQALELVARQGGDATTYYLLLREATQMQVVPNPQYVEQEMKELSTVGLGGPEVEAALLRWHMVVEAFETRIANGVRISPVIAEYNLLDQQQQVKLGLIPFKADDFRKQLPAATTRPGKQQLEEFFNKYKDKDSGSGEFGFGYRYPKRLALQYLMIPADAIRARLLTNIDLYNLYMDNPLRFLRVPETPKPTTAPTTRTASMTRPTTQPLASATTQPTTSPVAATSRPVPQAKQLTFDELTPDDLDSLRRDLADTGAEELAKKIYTRMAQHYAKFRQGDVATDLDVKYDAPEYFSKLVDSVWQSNRGNSNPWHDVRPLSNPDEIEKWLRVNRTLRSTPFTAFAARFLASLDIVDRSQSTALTRLDQLMQVSGVGAVPSFWLSNGFYGPFLTSRQREEINYDLMQRQQTQLLIKQYPEQASHYRMLTPQVSHPLQLWEPSEPIRDPYGNYYIFRIIQAEPETPPTSLDSYIYRYDSTGKDRVLDNYTSYEAYEAAKKKATECFDKLQKLVRENKGDAHPISEAAGEFSVKSEFMREFLKNQVGASPREFPLSTEGSAQFRKGAFDLLREKLKTGNPHPVAMIEVPYDKSIAVVRLEDSRSAPPDYAQLASAPRSSVYAAVTAAEYTWFNPQDIKARMQFTPSAEHESKSNQPQNNAPIAPPPDPFE